MVSPGFPATRRSSTASPGCFARRRHSARRCASLRCSTARWCCRGCAPSRPTPASCRRHPSSIATGSVRRCTKGGQVQRLLRQLPPAALRYVLPGSGRRPAAAPRRPRQARRNKSAQPRHRCETSPLARRASQDGYFEEALKLRNLLEELASRLQYERISGSLCLLIA